MNRLILAGALLALAGTANAAITCHSYGNTTRCYDSGGNTQTCHTYGNTTRCY